MGTHKQTRVIAITVFLVLLLGGALYYHFFQTAHFVIVLKGEKQETPVIAVATEGQGTAVIRQLKESVEHRVPEAVYFVEGELELKPYKGDMRVTGVEQGVEMLRKQLTPVLKGEAIFINGRPRVLLATRADAAEVIALVQERALERKKMEGIPRFVERVVMAPLKIEVKERDDVPVLPVEDAVNELTHKPRPRYHIVGKGDSFYLIASRRGLTVEAIKKLNPGMNPQALQPGDRVRLPDQLPPLTVVVKAESGTETN